jgi:uncharacterized protein involved in cysteine biosynthesis
MIRTWLYKQQQRHAAMLEWLTAKAKHSWMFSIVLVVWMCWELIEHIILPLAAAAFGALWLWGR